MLVLTSGYTSVLPVYRSVGFSITQVGVDFDTATLTCFQYPVLALET